MNAKVELQKDIDWDNRRTNVDSAKKLAVMQHMEYDGFRQMVLGAHIKPIKKGEAASIYQNKSVQGNINSIASYDKIAHSDDQIGFNEDFVKRVLNLEIGDLLQAPDNYQVFDKFISKKLKDSMQRYTYLRMIDFD